MKKTMYIDMDGVISNFAKAAKEQGNGNRPDLYVDYRNLEVMPGAKDALMQLNIDFDIFIASTPPWSRPECWGHKREWIEEHFPWLKRKMILTHRKDLLIGDILIDDSRWRGQPDFKGNWLWFGTAQKCLNWQDTLELIYKKYV
jgi:5'(3')-deoxyribonucleotidase|tara:strand:- start:772 stop:1203 length:432 start_codon:yes stop_codon:yes gene_type:complete